MVFVHHYTRHISRKAMAGYKETQSISESSGDFFFARQLPIWIQNVYKLTHWTNQFDSSFIFRPTLRNHCIHRHCYMSLMQTVPYTLYLVHLLRRRHCHWTSHFTDRPKLKARHIQLRTHSNVIVRQSVLHMSTCLVSTQTCHERLPYSATHGARTTTSGMTAGRKKLSSSFRFDWVATATEFNEMWIHSFFFFSEL